MDKYWQLLKDIGFMRFEFYGNTIFSWVLSLVFFLFACYCIRKLNSLLARRLGALARHTSFRFDDSIVGVFNHTRNFFVTFLAAYIASFSLNLDKNVSDTLQFIFVLVFILQAGFWLSYLSSDILQTYFRKKQDTDPSSTSALGLLSFVSRFLVWTLVLLLLLDNFGLDISALVAGLGVGGVAVALAVQNILGDLFASLSIILDKPFVVGDFIVLGEQMGTVEKIGIKTTRLRSLGGEQLIISNSDLLNSRVRNYKRMNERRIVFALGVTYDTSDDLMKEIPSILKEVIESQEKTRFDRAHFKGFGDFSLDFEVVYYVLSADYIDYMNVQEAMNFEILKRFRTRGIEFAFPSQTLYVEQGS